MIRWKFVSSDEDTKPGWSDGLEYVYGERIISDYAPPGATKAIVKLGGEYNDNWYDINSTSLHYLKGEEVLPPTPYDKWIEEGQYVLAERVWFEHNMYQYRITAVYEVEG